MEKNELKNKAESVIVDILGNGAFVFADLLDDSDSPAIDSWDSIGVALSFMGPHTGTLSLWTQTDFIRNLTANMLGVEDGAGIPLAQLVDAEYDSRESVDGNFRL